MDDEKPSGALSAGGSDGLRRAALLLWALVVQIPRTADRALSPVQVSPWEMGRRRFPTAGPLHRCVAVGRVGARGGLCLMALTGASAGAGADAAPLPPAAVAAIIPSAARRRCTHWFCGG